MIVFGTAIGVCGVRYHDAGITEILLPTRRDRHGRPADSATLPEPIVHAIDSIVALLGGDRSRDLREVELDQRSVDDFSRRVYAATRAIGPGQVATYGEIARAIGAPGAARAVGAALGNNPTPIVVPCHRVLAADGSLHGFSAPGGIATKRRMLEIEGAPGFTQEPLFA